VEESENGAVPRHVAIIMDGNGRWARRQGLARVRGHERGAETVRRVTRACARLGVRELTLFAFSAENWKRPRTEVAFLMRLLARYLDSEGPEMRGNDIRLRVIGRIEELAPKVRAALDDLIRQTRGNRGMVLRLALNYGGRGEIVDAVRRLCEEVRAGRLEPDQIDECRIQEHLYDPAMSDPDLLIRTAGEFRISNFLLWNLSYTEIHVSSVCWPAFSEEDLEEAIRSYQGRVRKFGGLEPTRC
jgi:undecaprenyl diphosphate synthase